MSYILHKPVSVETTERLAPTLLLGGAAFVLSSIVGLLLGIYAAVRQNAWQDKLITIVVLLGISTPSFWLGMLLILWFGVRPRLAAGRRHDRDVRRRRSARSRPPPDPAGPALAAVPGAVLVRLTRTTMLEVLRQDYVRTARAKGLSERRVILRHAFANALVNVIPILGIEAGYVLGGAVYIESVFQWPGIGRMLVSAISTRDILLVQGGVLLDRGHLCRHQPADRPYAGPARSPDSRRMTIAPSATPGFAARAGQERTPRRLRAAQRQPDGAGRRAADPGHRHPGAAGADPAARRRRMSPMSLHRTVRPFSPGHHRSAPTRSAAIILSRLDLGHAAQPRGRACSRRLSRQLIGSTIGLLAAYSRRADRHVADARHRHADGLPLSAARARHRRGARPRPNQCDDRDHRRQRAVLRARRCAAARCQSCAAGLHGRGAPVRPFGPRASSFPNCCPMSCRHRHRPLDRRSAG